MAASQADESLGIAGAGPPSLPRMLVDEALEAAGVDHVEEVEAVGAEAGGLDEAAPLPKTVSGSGDGDEFDPLRLHPVC